MEKKKKIIDVCSVEQKRLIPQETFFDSMTIQKQIFRVEWRPNNYRRYMNVKIKLDSTLNVLSKEFKGKCCIGKRNKLFSTKAFCSGVTLQYGRKVLTAMFPQKYIDGEKEVFVIENTDFKVIQKWIIDKREEIKDLMDGALIDFARKYNVMIPMNKPFWSRHEDWTIDDEIRKIPEWEILHGANIKKVYPKGIEFHGGKDEEPTLMLLNRIRNSALKDYAPEVAKAILLSHPLRFLKSILKDQEDVLNYPDVVNVLTKDEKDDLSSWMFDKFSI